VALVVLRKLSQYKALYYLQKSYEDQIFLGSYKILFFLKTSDNIFYSRKKLFFHFKAFAYNILFFMVHKPTSTLFFKLHCLLRFRDEHLPQPLLSFIQFSTHRITLQPIQTPDHPSIHLFI